MRSTLSLMSLSLFLVPSQLIMAGEQTGEVYDLRVSSGTLLNPTHVVITGAASGKPACATTAYWSIDTDTVAGRNFLAVLLTAQAAGKAVKIYGTNACTLRSDMENVAQIQIMP